MPPTINICARGGNYPSGHVCSKNNSRNSYPSDHKTGRDHEHRSRPNHDYAATVDAFFSKSDDKKKEEPAVCVANTFLQVKADGSMSFKTHIRGPKLSYQREIPLVESLRTSPNLSVLTPNLTDLSFQDKDLSLNELFAITTLLRNRQLPNLKKLNLSGNKRIQSPDLIQDFAIYFAIPGSSLVSLDLSCDPLAIHNFRDLALAIGMTKQPVYVKISNYPLINYGLLSDKATLDYTLFKNFRAIKHEGSGGINMVNFKIDALTLKMLKEAGANLVDFVATGGVKDRNKYEIKTLSEALKKLYSGKTGLSDTCISTQSKSFKMGLGLVSCIAPLVNFTDDELSAIQHGNFFRLPTHKISSSFSHVQIGICALETFYQQQVTPSDFDCIASLEELNNGWMAP